MTADEVVEVQPLTALTSASSSFVATSPPNGTRPLVIQSEANSTLLPSTNRTMVLSSACAIGRGSTSTRLPPSVMVIGPV